MQLSSLWSDVVNWNSCKLWFWMPKCLCSVQFNSKTLWKFKYLVHCQAECRIKHIYIFLSNNHSKIMRRIPVCFVISLHISFNHPPTVLCLGSVLWTCVDYSHLPPPPTPLPLLLLLSPFLLVIKTFRNKIQNIQFVAFAQAKCIKQDQYAYISKMLIWFYQIRLALNYSIVLLRCLHSEWFDSNTLQKSASIVKMSVE